MTYSGAMTEQTLSKGANGAPDFTLNYPSGGRILGPAWAFMWGRLVDFHASYPGDHIDGRELAEEAAEHVARLLKVDAVGVETCAHLLRRAARTQVPILDMEIRKVAGKRGPRDRAFYRLSADARERYLNES